MALITSDYAKDAIPEHQMALTTSGCAPLQWPTLYSDVARFMLVRGDYSWIGIGWEGCVVALDPEHPQHGLSSKNMALITSDHGIMC